VTECKLYYLVTLVFGHIKLMRVFEGVRHINVKIISSRKTFVIQINAMYASRCVMRTMEPQLADRDP